MFSKNLKQKTPQHQFLGVSDLVTYLHIVYNLFYQSQLKQKCEYFKTLY